jgi:hypothetical protein
MANLLSVLFDAIRRIRAGKQKPPSPPIGTPPGPSTNAVPPTGRWKVFDLPPEDIEFLQEIGLGPEELEKPFQVPTLGTAPAIPSDTLDLIRSGIWIGVSSSNVAQWRFNEAAKTIDVEFLSGAVYRYANCTTNNAIQFSASPSPGRYVWYVFRVNPQRYPFRKLRDANRTAEINPRTGKGFVIQGPRTKWKYRKKSTGRTAHPPWRPWP